MDKLDSKHLYVLSHLTVTTALLFPHLAAEEAKCRKGNVISKWKHPDLNSDNPASKPAVLTTVLGFLKS